MFGPSCTCIIEDAYTGKARTVDNVPLGVGVAGTAISGIGYGVTRLLEQGFSTFDRTSEHQFAEPLRILNKIRTVAESDMIFNAINRELGPRANGAPSDSKQALINYLSECTMAKIQLGGTTPTELYSATWNSEAFKFTSEAHTVMLPIGGMGNSEVVTCNAGYAKLNTILQKFSSSQVKQAVNQYLHLKDENGNTIATNMDKVDSAMQALNATMNGSQDYMQMVVIESVYNQAAAKFYNTQQDTASAIAVNQGIIQRNTQWASEGTMFLSASRALMAFFEGFIYAITPIMGFLIAIGSFGIGLVSKYFLTIAWIQLWLPILSILNLYILTGARSAITDANLGTGASFYAIDTLWSETATWVATGGMLTAATPMLALFLVSGSTFAFTSLAGRLNGQDHFNERIATPDAASPSAVMSHAAMATANRTTGTVQTALESYLPKLNISNAVSANESYTEQVQRTAAAQAGATLQQLSDNSVAKGYNHALNESIGRNVSASMQNSHQTMLQKASEDKEFASLSRDAQHTAMGEMSANVNADGSIKAGAVVGTVDKDGNFKAKDWFMGYRGLTGAKVDGGFGLGVSGNVKATGGYSLSVGTGRGNSQTYGLGISANETRQLGATLTDARTAAFQGVDARTWQNMAQSTKGTRYQEVFQRAANATEAYNKAKQVSSIINAAKPDNFAATVNSLEGTAGGRYLAELPKNMLNTPEDLNRFKALSKQYASGMYGESRGKIAAGYHMLQEKIADPAVQAKLAEVLSTSKLPQFQFSTIGVSKPEDLQGPGNVDQKIAEAKSKTSVDRANIENAKPEKFNALQRAKFLMNTENPANDFNKGSELVSQKSGEFFGQVNHGQQQKALQELSLRPNTNMGVNFASNVLQFGAVDGMEQRIFGEPPTSPTNRNPQNFTQWLAEHSQTMYGYTAAQTQYVEKLHGYMTRTNPFSDSEAKELQGAAQAVRLEMSQAFFGTRDVSKLTEDQQQFLHDRSVEMIDHLTATYTANNDAVGVPVKNFNLAYGLKPKQ